MPEEGLYAWFPDWLKIMSWNAFFAIVLSIVPGLPHLAQRRFRQIRWYFVSWVAFILAGMFLYGSNMGFLLLGLAVAAHAWMAFHASLIKEHEESGRRAFDIVMLLVFFAFVYWGARVVIFRDFVWGYTSLTIPYQSVQSGDCLLARRSLASGDVLSRGSLVLAPVRQVGVGRRGWTATRAKMIVQIVGLPGEKVGISNASFVINGKVLDSRRFPVPRWLLGADTWTIAVPADSYFVSTEYNVGPQTYTDAIGSACLARPSEIEAKATMRWFPLTRRGFLRPYE
jgi:hypothetical protein